MKLKIFALVNVLLLSGCSLFVSENSFGESWKGEPVASLISQWGEPAEKISTDSGEMEVIYKIFSDSCTYHFYTDAKGVIFSYKYESTTWGTCKPIG